MDEEVQIGATEFKNSCLELLDRVAARDIKKLVITKRGRPVAVLTPPATDEEAVRSMFGFMRGSVVVPEGFDLTAPVMDEPLSAERGVLHE
jgi:prevent-host-death family protein